MSYPHALELTADTQVCSLTKTTFCNMLIISSCFGLYKFLRDRRTVTLGRPGVDFLRVTRFRDAIYFEDKVASDKKPPHWNEM